MVRSGSFARIRDTLDQPAHPVGQVVILIGLLTVFLCAACGGLTFIFARAMGDAASTSQASATLRDYCADVIAHDWAGARAVLASGAGDPGSAWTGREAAHGKIDTCEASGLKVVRSGDKRIATARLLVWYVNNTHEYVAIQLTRDESRSWLITSPP